MTMELLERIIEENNIPKDVHFMMDNGYTGDSGWESNPTEMQGIFYNRQNNTIVFTESGISEWEYGESDEWEMLYDPDVIMIEELKVYPVSSRMSFGITESFKKALKEAGDFEEYYGIKETEDKYDAIDFRWRPFFYSIKMNGDFIGYIGFNGGDSALEPEIYIFKQYRNMGYGTRVLRRFIDIVFKYGLEKKYSEETERIDSVYSPRYSNVIPNASTVFPQNLYATVRVENEFSKRMMLACGFRENKEETIFRLIIDKDNSESGLIHVSKFEITKEEYQKRG